MNIWPWSLAVLFGALAAWLLSPRAGKTPSRLFDSALLYSAYCHTEAQECLKEDPVRDYTLTIAQKGK